MLSFTKSRLAGKALIQTLFFFLLVSQICFAQWYQQSSGTTQNLNGVAFYDLNNGIIVGDTGIILGTTNGGTNWIVFPPSGNNTNLYAVFYRPGNWVAVGAEGTILHNGNIQPSGTTNDLFGVSFTDANTGTAVGDSGTILRTTNGGTTWISQTSGTTYPLYGVSFTDANTGTAVGGYVFFPISYSIILRTTNGGTTWNLQSSGSWHVLHCISFIDENTGTAVGDSGIIHRTTDGGTTWSSQTSGTEDWLLSVSFTDANTGTAVGGFWSGTYSEGIILRTTDGGATWTSQTTGELLYGVSFTDANNGWAVGWNGNILHTTNGGATFVEEENIDELPSKFLLSQNYPNPFNPITKIKYSIPQSSQVQVKVFDVLGNEIETLVNEEKPACTYEITWYAANLPSGIYFYQLNAGSFVETKKMVLMK